VWNGTAEFRVTETSQSFRRHQAHLSVWRLKRVPKPRYGFDMSNVPQTSDRSVSDQPSFIVYGLDQVRQRRRVTDKSKRICRFEPYFG
jgi:hypothetical protein